MALKQILSYLARVLLILAAAFLPHGCTPESCYENIVSGIKGGFYQTGTGLKISPDSVSLFGPGIDSPPLYSKATGLKEVVFPLNPAEPACSYIFTINGIRDTVTFTYTSFPHLISRECGYSMFHTLNSCISTGNIIDTIIIINRTIAIPYEENIRIFLED